MLSEAINPRQHGVHAVVVTFNPRMEALRCLLDALSPQVEIITVVDNGSVNEMQTWEPESYDNVQIHRIGTNLGIAAAHNIGIKKALDEEVDYVLLSDQDSIPTPNMVFELRKAAEQLTADGQQVAAVGPFFIDDKIKKSSQLIRFQGLRLIRLFQDSDGPVAEVAYLISSGCLIPKQTLKAVGLMNEALFVDYVDIDWGFRAKHRGFSSFGIFKAEMRHGIGNKPIKFMGRRFSNHSPARHYYMMRNAIWLYKQSHAPVNWKMIDSARLALRMCLYLVCSRNRRTDFKMMLKGLLHGSTSRLGPLPESEA